MLAAPALIVRSMTNYWAGVSGNGNRKLFQDGGQIKREKDIYHHSPRPIYIYHLPPSRPLLFLTGRPLSKILRIFQCF